MKTKLMLLAALCGLTFNSALAQAADTVYPIPVPRRDQATLAGRELVVERD